MTSIGRHLASLAGALALSCSALAAVTLEEAAQLDAALTPMGAERAGNVDGSIPAWSPQNLVIPEDFVPGSDHYPDPYAGEAPLYTVTADNWGEYEPLLTEGTREMFRKLGQHGFRMLVYPSKRTSEAPDWYYANTRKNATGARLVAGGQKIEGNLPGVPFPLPQSGLEVLWNHMVRYAEPASQTYDVYYVGANGKPVLSTTAFSASIFQFPL